MAGMSSAACLPPRSAIELHSDAILRDPYPAYRESNALSWWARQSGI